MKIITLSELLRQGKHPVWCLECKRFVKPVERNSPQAYVFGLEDLHNRACEKHNKVEV